MSKQYDTTLVSIIIVNYNGVAYLERCLQALQKQTFEGYEVIVVDNGSTDGSLVLLKTFSSYLKIIKNSENAGFAKGNNAGISIAKGKYIVTLNNDTVVTDRWLAELVGVAESDETIGMCASKILHMNDAAKIDSVGMLIYPDGTSKQRGFNEIDTGQYNAQEEVLFPSACAALYRQDMLEEIGLFDDDFFCYCEDVDLGLRARRAGWKAVYAPAAVVYHAYSATAGPVSALKAFYIERNHLFVVIKNFPARLLLLWGWYALQRYCYALYNVVTGKGKTGTFVRQHSRTLLCILTIRAWIGVMRYLLQMVKKRKTIMKTTKISTRMFTDLITQKHCMSSHQLGLYT